MKSRRAGQPCGDKAVDRAGSGLGHSGSGHRAHCRRCDDKPGQLGSDIPCERTIIPQAGIQVPRVRNQGVTARRRGGPLRIWGPRPVTPWGWLRLDGVLRPEGGDRRRGEGKDDGRTHSGKPCWPGRAASQDAPARKIRRRPPCPGGVVGRVRVVRDGPGGPGSARAPGVAQPVAFRPGVGRFQHVLVDTRDPAAPGDLGQDRGSPADGGGADDASREGGSDQ